jgi:hypothetical protein
MINIDSPYEPIQQELIPIWQQLMLRNKLTASEEGKYQALGYALERMEAGNSPLFVIICLTQRKYYRQAQLAKCKKMEVREVSLENYYKAYIDTLADVLVKLEALERS